MTSQEYCKLYDLLSTALDAAYDLGKARGFWFDGNPNEKPFARTPETLEQAKEKLLLEIKKHLDK